MAETDIRTWRKALRERLLAEREAVPLATRRARDERITAALLDRVVLPPGAVIAFYWPFRGEFDPRVAVLRLRERGARAALPVVVAKAAPLQFREWTPDTPMTRGVFDLPIPDITQTVTPQAFLIPPIGFDARGYRLGYGGGYFDRTLAGFGARQPLKVGVAYEMSRIETIRPQAWDIPMSCIVTESGVREVPPAD